MRKFLSYLLTAFLGAFLAVIVMIGFNKLATVYPLYLPNLFYKENINYNVNVDSAISKAIAESTDTVVQVDNYQNGSLYGTGSGVIYKLDGTKAYIVTNNHVVEGASSLTVLTSEGTQSDAHLVGTDAVTDLAVITIPVGNIKNYLEFSDSNALKVGDYAIAIGSPLGLSGTATMGIVSSTERLIPVDTNGDNRPDWYASVLQTDAAINPGNSGGALINLDGKLVGINSMKIAEQNVEGIGFSIPSGLVMRIISELESNGKVTRIPHVLGVTVIGSTYANLNAYLIQKITAGSVAAQNGLEVNDLIIKINGTDIQYFFDLQYYLATTPSGGTISLSIERNGNLIEKTITIP